ncbi:hypothetical protein CRUP_014163, partial [Coryphaenoides rupestris]
MEMEEEVEVEFGARFPLHRACRDGDVGALRSLLLLLLRCRGGGGDPAAHLDHLLECVVHLVRVGCDVNAATTRSAQTPVLIAAFGGHPECVLWLLQAGADVNRQDCAGESPVHKAARAGSMDCVQTLLLHGAKPDLRNTTGLTPADLARAQGFWDCFQLLSNAQNHLAQLGHGVTHQGALAGAGNRKRLIDELENIMCMKRARTDDDTKGLFNGHRKPPNASCNIRFHATAIAPLKRRQDEPSAEEEEDQRHRHRPPSLTLANGDAVPYDDDGNASHRDRRRSDDMCGSLHRAASPGAVAQSQALTSDLGDLLHYGHCHGFGDTAEDIGTC